MSKYSDLNSSGGKVIDNIAVEQSMDNIISLSSFDVFFNQAGSNLENLLFRPMNKTTADAIYFVLVTSFSKIDDRIVIDQQNSQVTPDYDGHAYDVLLKYSIKGLDESMYTYSRSIPVVSKG